MVGSQELAVSRVFRTPDWLADASEAARFGLTFSLERTWKNGDTGALLLSLERRVNYFLHRKEPNSLPN